MAEPDRLTLEAFITPSEAMSGLPVGESDLAGSFPADTQLYVEVRDLGATITNALTSITAMAGDESGARWRPSRTCSAACSASSRDGSVGAGLAEGSLWLGNRRARSPTRRRPTGAAEPAGHPRASPRRTRGRGVSVASETVGDAEVTTITLPIDAAEMGLPFDIGQTVSIAVADGSC